MPNTDYPTSTPFEAYVSCTTVLAENQADRRELFEQCQEIATSEDVLWMFDAAIRENGLGGSTKNAKTLYLALCTRLFDQDLVSAVVQGPPGAGKSYMVNSVLKFFPESAFKDISDMSPTALSYLDEDLQHRFLVVQELAGMGGTRGNRNLRTLLTEGYLRRTITVPAPEGGHTTIETYRPGPTGLITTTTETEIFHEDETRYILLQVTGSREELRMGMDQTARRYAGGFVRQASDPLDRWLAFQHWLELGDHRVVVDYAPTLAGLVQARSLRLNRDLPKLFAMVCASALIHQEHRERDTEGKILADLRDYEIVHELVADVIAASAEADVPSHIRELVNAVATLQDRNARSCTNRELEQELMQPSSTVCRWVQEAQRLGYIRNLDPNPGRPSRLAVGEAMPTEDDGLLPDPEVLRAAL